MPICPRCGRQIPEEDYRECPFCGAFPSKQSSDLEMAIIYITLLLGGIFTALFFGVYYIAYLLLLAGIILFATLLYEKQRIVRMIGFFVGSLLGASWVIGFFLSLLGGQYGIEIITSVLMILTSISLMYNPFKEVEWTDEMYRSGASIGMRLITWILVLRPVVLILGMVCILQGILLISYGQTLLDVFNSLGTS